MNDPVRTSEFRLKLYPGDFARARAFYEDVLAFPVIQEWDRGKDDEGVMFDTGSGMIELLSPDGPYVPFAGVDVSLEVSDVRALWERFEGKENVVFSIRDNAWGDTSFCLADPDGLELTFFTIHSS